MRVGLFHSNQLSLRGTEIALYDYAHYNETLLGNRSIIVIPKAGYRDRGIEEKFKARFEVYFHEGKDDLERFAKKSQADFFYSICSGQNEGNLVDGVRNCIHAVFRYNEPHGDVYAYISSWLSQEMTAGQTPFVPHMVHLPDTTEDLREELGIPRGATVFGRYGGADTFDIPFVQRLIWTLSKQRPDLYFLFMNTEDFMPKQETRLEATFNRVAGRWFGRESKRANVLFLPGQADLTAKTKFINTCDAMIHARLQGESFGLACAEFSIKNKPVITCNGEFIPERCHLEILGDKGIYYRNASELRAALTRFQKQPERDWDAYSKDYNPTKVMELFQRVFLDSPGKGYQG